MEEITKWRLQQTNNAKPFPYVFPNMPPRFRRCSLFMKVLFLLELGCFGIAGFGSFVFIVPLLTFGVEVTAKKPILTAFLAVTFLALALCFLFLLLGNLPGLFWKCPNCGQPFPYYAPRRSSLDTLKRKDCLTSIKNLRIKYVQPKFCPLILPSVCPTCRTKFFDMGQRESNTKSLL